MKIILTLFCLSVLIVGCQAPQDNSANEAFEKNSQTVLAILEGFQDENLDYSQYAKDFVMGDTGFGGKDTLNLEEVKKNDKGLWENYNLKIITDPIVLLPGVNVDTKLADGSVRLYAEWEVTLPATDSTEAKSGILKLYESFDFDSDGKVIFQQAYGDFAGLFGYLHSPASDEQ